MVKNIFVNLFNSKKPTRQEDSKKFLQICDLYMCRYRATLPLNVVEHINNLSEELVTLSKENKPNNE